LKKVYKNNFFIKFAKFNKAISTNDVINTNNCLISVCKSKYKDKIIILSAIDNLIKGGSGQGVQNMNVIYNFPESRGLI
jgi:N-acetyl-gamma-glutamyl-phosphate reductase